jgi:hypothetical protein
MISFRTIIFFKCGSFLNGRKQKVELQTIVKIIFAFKIIHVFTFIEIFNHSYGFELLSCVLSFHSSGVSWVFLTG